MQGDNDVRQTAGTGDSAMWTSVYTNELVKLIKSVHGSQSGLVEHIKNEHNSRPTPLSKQTLSKQLNKKRPDWLLAMRAIECCTHGDSAATERELARFAGIYEAATGEVPNGYKGQRIAPQPPPSEDCPVAQQAELQRLRRSLSETQAQLDARERELANRENMIDALTSQVRTLAVTQTAAQEKLGLMRQQIDQLRVELSDSTARYEDQAARADAADSRRRSLWERYALLNASYGTTGASRPVLELGALALHRPGLSRRINPDAPAPRQALAIYLNSYRELAERHLGTIGAASRIGDERLTAIFLAEADPTLQEALDIAAAVTAPRQTVERLHATIAEGPAAGSDTDPRQSPPEPQDNFTAIVATMEGPLNTATVGTADGRPRATPWRSPTVAVPCDGPAVGDTVPAAVGRAAVPQLAATVARDRRRRSVGTGDGSPLTVADDSLRTERIVMLLSVFPWLAISAGVMVYLRPHATRLLMSTVDMIFVSVMAGMVITTAIGAAVYGLVLASRRIARLFYRGRHTRRRRSRPAATTSVPDLTTTLDLSLAHRDGAWPSLPQRFTPRPGHDASPHIPHENRDNELGSGVPRTPPQRTAATIPQLRLGIHAGAVPDPTPRGRLVRPYSEARDRIAAGTDPKSIRGGPGSGHGPARTTPGRP